MPLSTSEVKGDEDLDEMMAAVVDSLPGAAEQNEDTTGAAAVGVDDLVTIEAGREGPVTREELQMLLAPRDEVLAGLLQAIDATKLVTAASKERRALEIDLVKKYGKAGVTGADELDIVSEYSRMVAVFLLLSAIGWTITVLDIVGVLDGGRGDAMARAIYASTFPMSVTICPMLYYGTLGFGMILSDGRLNIVCYIAFILDGLCYGEEFFDAGWLYPHLFAPVDSGSQGAVDYGSTPTWVLGIIYAIVVAIVFGWLGVNTLALGRRRVLERKLSLPHFSETFCSSSMKVVAFQAILGVMQIVNVATAEDAEQLARVIRINEASHSFSVALGAGYVTKVLIFDVPGLTIHAFFNGNGSRWSVVGVVCGSLGGLTGIGGWLLAYQTNGSSNSASFDVAAVLGNISCSALTAANAASAVNFIRDVPGGCGQFVRKGAEAAWQLRTTKETEWSSNPSGTTVVPLN